MACGYSDAREFFEAVREASAEAERARAALMRMEAREGVRAQGYEARGRSGGGADRTEATDARMDYEERMRRRLEEDYALIDLACRCSTERRAAGAAWRRSWAARWPTRSASATWTPVRGRR